MGTVHPINMHGASFSGALLALFATMWPVVQMADQTIGLGDLPGVSQVLYLLPLLIIFVAAYSSHRYHFYVPYLYLILAGIGFGVLAYSVVIGRGRLLAEAGENGLQASAVSFGVGGVFMWIAYLVLMFLPFLHLVKNEPLEMRSQASVSKDEILTLK